MAKVELKNLTKVYGQNTVVDHINLEIENGTLVSILGPSGCGKTTTLRMIAGFEHPEDGDVLFDGQTVSTVPVNKRNIGMVFQSYALFPHMTVEQNVAYGLEQNGTPKSEIPGRVKRSAGDGSYGRVCKAQAEAAFRRPAAESCSGKSSRHSSESTSSGRMSCPPSTRN